MYISLWENSRGHPDNVSFMQFSTKIDGFFHIHHLQNYTLALNTDKL